MSPVSIRPRALCAAVLLASLLLSRFAAAFQELSVARLSVSPEGEVEDVGDDPATDVADVEASAHHPEAAEVELLVGMAALPRELPHHEAADFDELETPAHHEAADFDQLVGVVAQLREGPLDEGRPTDDAALVDDTRSLLQRSDVGVGASPGYPGAADGEERPAVLSALAGDRERGEAMAAGDAALLLGGPISASIVFVCCLAGPLAAAGVVLVALLVAALVCPDQAARYKPRLAAPELAVVMGCLAVPLLTTYGMFGGIEGAGLSPRAWFPWHPVLMALSLPCFMVLGRFTYVAETTQQLDAETRRWWHRAVMIAALVAMLGGYATIWLAHWETQQFLGYDFRAREWKPMKRIAHVWLGYGILGLCFAQAWMGGSKYAAKDKIYPQHGFLGQLILVLGFLQMLVATWVWSWARSTNLVMAAVLCVALYGALVPKERARDMYAVESNGS